MDYGAESKQTADQVQVNMSGTLTLGTRRASCNRIRVSQQPGAVLRSVESRGRWLFGVLAKDSLGNAIVEQISEATAKVETATKAWP